MRPADTSRRTTTQRGYGTEHQKVRASYEPSVAAGDAWCCERVCLEPDRWIRPGTPWDLAHDHHHPGQYLGPAHAHCNRAEGARYRDRHKRRRRWRL